MGQDDNTQQAKARLFLSYSRDDDEPFVRRLYDDLTVHGFHVWFDRVSMPSRHLTFHQEIRDAIAERDRLILVVGPAAATSDYVRQEWLFASEFGKLINPVLRLGDFDLLPSELLLLDTRDFRDDKRYAVEFERLVEQLRGAPPLMGKLIAVPSLPPHFLERKDQLRMLKEALLADLQGPAVVTGEAAYAGLYGMGGIGKSVLAAAVANEREVRRAFVDGVAWIALGQTPDLRGLQQGLVKALSQGDAYFENVHQSRDALKELLFSKAVLLILDDLWDKAHVDAFDVLGPRCRMVVTTRDASLLTTLGGMRHEVQVLGDQEALSLMARWAQQPREQLPDIATEVVQECGRLPLALAICGAIVRDGTPWGDLLDALREAELEFLEHDLPHYRHATVYRAIKISIDALSEEHRRRFAELAVFQPDEPIPEAAVCTLWAHTGDLSARHTRRLLTTLNSRSLLRLETETTPSELFPQRRVSLHDLLHDYATRILGDSKALHESLLAAYHAKCNDGWATGPDDGYFFQKLGHHFVKADRASDWVNLLLDLRWLEAKHAAGLVFDLGQDFDRSVDTIPNDDPRRRLLYLLGKALRREIHFIHHHREDYPQALLQCIWNHAWWYDSPEAQKHYEPLEKGWNDSNAPWLRDGPKLHELVERWQQEREFAKGSYSWIRLLRPPALSLESGIIDLRLDQGEVTDVAFFPDEKHLVASCTDSMLYLWNLESGRLAGRLRAHDARVNSVDVSPDGWSIVSGSDDATARLWDVKTQRELAAFRGHQRPVNCVKFFPNSQWIASGGRDSTVRIWTLKAGCQELCCLEHPMHVLSIAVAPNGRLLASNTPYRRWCPSNSVGGSIRLWSLHSNTPALTLAGHLERSFNGRGSTGMVFSPDGSRLYFASDEETVCGWCTTTGQQVWKNSDVIARVTDLKWQPEKDRLVSSHVLFSSYGYSSPPLCFFDVLDAKECSRVASIDLPVDVKKIAVSSSGKLLAAVTAEGIKVMNLERCLGPATRLRTADICTRIFFSEDGLSLTWFRNVVGVGYFGNGNWSLKTWREEPYKKCEPYGSTKENAKYSLVPSRDETAFKVRGSDKIAGWYPEVLEDMSEHPTGRIWAGCRGSYVVVIALEGCEDTGRGAVGSDRHSA